VRILTRYILGEISSHAVIGCALFTFILVMKDLPVILDMAVRNSSTMSLVFQFFLFLLPNTFLLTIPMAVLVGVLLGLSRLAADSEITAMRASGFGIWYFVRVAGIVALLGTVFGLFNSLYVSPRANQAILEMRKELETSQASFEIQPRVFYEDFKNTVVYVQDVRSGTGASNWRQLFIADLTDPASPGITTAETATVTDDKEQGLLIRLRNGSDHQTAANQPGQYNVSTFVTTDRPLAFSPQGEVHLGRMDTPLFAMGNRQLLRMARETQGPDRKHYQIEFQRRLAYPAACMVLMLVGVPLGAASRRGGKSSGFVFTLLLVLVYYLLSNFGIAWGKQGRLPAAVGVWLANVLFTAAGIFLLSQMASGGAVLSNLVSWFSRTPKPQGDGSDGAALQNAAERGNGNGVAAERNPWPLRQTRARFRSMLRQVIPRVFPKLRRRGFPLILDNYVLREFLKTFLIVLAGFVLMNFVFTYFELMSDILHNHIEASIVGAYLINLTPSVIYQITPLSVLIAVLVTFGVLNRTSELTAMKATGISLYRLIIPVLLIAVTVAAGLFAFDQFYLPQANRKQEALRNTIKGRPPQTTLHPDQKWIFGQQRPGEPAHIFYYQFFDPDQNAFANLSLFEFDPTTFSISKRVMAARVAWDADQHAWIFENGWERSFHGANQTGFREFQRASFAELHEEPSYFKKESLQSQEMNFGQLDRYIRDLQQSGFDTMRLRVQLYDKLAYPLVTIVMAVLAVPFALSMGRRGSLTGVAWAFAIALGYWVVSGLFDAMGTHNYLPAAIAAWSPDVLFGLTGGYLLLRTPT
jgi:LPS export ABC transporter permease LptF/LPS export ABC transporter permease LptG